MATLTKAKHKQYQSRIDAVHAKRSQASNTESPILTKLKEKRLQLAAIGCIASLWQLFSPMVSIQTSGTVKPFDPYDYQIDLVNTIDQSQSIVVCKSRQLGVSETVCCYLLMRAVTEQGFSAVVFSKSGQDASELAQRIRMMAVSLGGLCPDFASDSKQRLEFQGLGKIFFLAPTAKGGRSIPSVSVVFFDEAAHIDLLDSLYQAAIPTLSMLGDKGKVILASTPNGRTGLYYRLLVAGVGESAKVNDTLKDIRQSAANNIVNFRRHTKTWTCHKWAKVFLHWKAHPIYGADPDWAERTREDKQLTESQWNQEYELDFLEGNRSVFALELIEKCAIGVFSAPIPGRKYIAGVDTNLGGADYFVAQVWDVTVRPYSLVAEYRKNRSGKDYNIVNSLTMMEPYRPYQVNVETNSGGALYLEEYTKSKPGWKWEGICTTNTSKIVNTDRLVLFSERGQWKFPKGCPLADELSHFIESAKGTTRTRQAESGYNDDTVMASAVAFATFVNPSSAFDYY